MEDEDPVKFFMSLDGWQERPFDQDDDLSSQGLLPSESYLLGFVLANIVGIQYYSGRISGREMVGLVREPLNRYDSNAIKVLNTRTIQVGHIEKNVAAVLAPLMDSNLISVEGIVPNTRSSDNRYRIPCQIHVFARFEAFDTVKSAITRGGLQFIKDFDPAFSLSKGLIVKEKRTAKETRSLDDIFKLVDEKVSKKGELEPLEPPKEVIKSQLFAHQKEGLGWLVHRENSSDLPPFWEEKDGLYVNVLTNYESDRRPEPLRGGIFADDMGLGKTLTLLSLIALDKCSGSPRSIAANSSVEEDIQEEMCENSIYFPVSGSRKRKLGRISKKSSESRTRVKSEGYHPLSNPRGKSSGVEELSADFGRKTTLVVCPPSVFSTWMAQLMDHTRPGSLKAYMYYGDRTNDPEELKKYDIVMTTYNTLASENSRGGSAAMSIEWWRVILDEAHVIKNATANQSQAVTNLNAKRRWVVTGTPIQNGSFDLFSLMVFLRFNPFSVKTYWQSLVQRPLGEGNEKGLSRLQVLMATISLRRTKDKGVIGLPPKTVETCYVELCKEERDLYDQLEGEAKGIVRGYINSGSLMVNYSTVLSIILRLRQICTDLALCPSDLTSVLPSESIEDVSKNPELLRKLVEVLQDGEDFDCPICISPPVDVVITRCAHIFCQTCILKTLKRNKPCCPLCRGPLSQSDLFSGPPKSSDADDPEISPSSLKTSSKVSALLKLLAVSRDENPSSKSVVFSQFRKMLVLLEEPLKAAGFKTLRLDGFMNAKRRAKVIEEFAASAKDEPTILLASLKASGTGINLTAASRVYLMEPWWNPAVEEQAMDRVHRIGQHENVKVVRLIVRNSIEERILELQEKKKKLAREAFGGKGPNNKEIGNEDLRILMSL